MRVEVVGVGRLSVTVSEGFLFSKVGSCGVFYYERKKRAGRNPAGKRKKVVARGRALSTAIGPHATDQPRSM